MVDSFATDAFPRWNFQFYCPSALKKLTIIGRGWAKYRDLSMASRSMSRRQIIDLRDTDKSRYFAITEFNNCFIIRSPTLFFFNEYPREAKRSTIFTQERSQEGEKQGFLYAYAEYYLQPVWFAAKHFQTQLYGIAHKQTIICRQLFAGHVVGVFAILSTSWRRLCGGESRTWAIYDAGVRPVETENIL